MKKALAVFLMFNINLVFGAEDWTNPEAKFDASKVMAETVSITWNRVDNIRATCESESRKRGLKGFGYSMEACSFWGKDNKGADFCHIFTRKQTTLHDLGHEARHCFQGNFH